MVADEVVETPYVVCKTTVLTVELIGNLTRCNRHYTTHQLKECVRFVSSKEWLSEKESNLCDRGISTT